MITGSHHKLARLRQYADFTMDRSEIAMGKHRLLAEINFRQELRSRMKISMTERLQLFSFRISRKLIPRYQIVVAFLIVILLTTSTNMMAQAAVPGDFLWPVKLSFEKAELAFAVDSIQEGRLHIKHADNRLRELTVVVSKPDTKNKSQNISQLVRRLEKDITAADQSLKLIKEETKDSHPQVIVALAKDLNNKATEAVKALEENMRVLEPGVVPTLIESITGVTSTTTVDLDASQSLADGTTATTSESGATQSVAEVAQEKRDLKQVITEVQLVNEYISYNALEAMIEMVERRGATNRAEVTNVVSERIQEQREKLSAIQEATALINENFLLHRTQAQLLAKRSDKALNDAETALKLENLSTALKQLNDAKDLIGQAADLLAEVESGHGFKEKVIDVPKPAVTSRKIMIQAVGSSTEPILEEMPKEAVR